MSYLPLPPLGQTTKTGSLPVTVASDQGALTVSGTVTSNAGTNLNTSALALESGGNLAAIANAAVAQGTTAPTKVIVVGGKSNDGTAQYKEIPLGASARSVIVEGFAGGTAVPISAASLPLPSTAATSTKQSDGTQKTQVVDGSGNVISATSNALDVNVKTNAATNQSTNVAQVNGVTVQTGTGTAGTGSQRVAVASDSSINATLAAETTKVIGVTRTADGSGNLLTSTSNALDVNLKTSAASNISSNVAQINAVTPLMGAGNTGTGSLRVTIATDQAAVTIKSTSGAPTETTPTVATATSVTLVASNASRKYLLVQNDSAANILVSLSGNTLTGIVPTSSNKGLVLIPGASYESPAGYVSTSAITGYQTSGSSINTVVVVEG